MATIRALVISIAISAVLWVVGSTLFVHSFLTHEETPVADPLLIVNVGELKDEDIDEGIRSAVGCLTRLNHRDGKFLYRVNLNDQVEVTADYNLLRHAGAIYALATYEELHTNQRTREVLLRSAEFLRREAIGPVAENPELLAVWTRPEDDDFDGEQTAPFAKLGGAGLGLVALTSLERVVPDATSLEELRGLGRFILFMQKDDGSFYSQYVPDQEGRSDEFLSLYYPGEAILGLVMLYELDLQPKWLRAAANGMAALARQRQGKSAVEADHWALLATAKLLPHYDQLQRPPVPREALVVHAQQICHSILSERPAIPRRCREHGCFSPDGRTCPTATRLEGLQAALEFLPPEQEKLRRRIEHSVRHGLAFLLRAQIKSGSYAGGVPRAIHTLSPNHSFYSEAFNQRATEVRIDYVQHALSALIAFQRRQDNEQRQAAPSQ